MIMRITLSTYASRKWKTRRSLAFKLCPIVLPSSCCLMTTSGSRHEAAGVKNLAAQVHLHASGNTTKEGIFKTMFLDEVLEAYFLKYTSEELERMNQPTLSRYELYQVFACYCFSCYYGMTLADLYDHDNGILYRPGIKKKRMNDILRVFRSWPRPKSQVEEYEALDGVAIESEAAFKIHQRYCTNYKEFETALNQRLKKFYDSHGWLVIDDDHIRCRAKTLEDEQLFSHYNPDKASGPVLDITADQRNRGMVVRVHLRGLKESPTSSMVEMLHCLGDTELGGELLAYVNADREFTSFSAVNFAVACGAQTCSTVRRESNFSIVKKLPFWFETYSGQSAPNPSGMTIPRSGAFSVYKAIRSDEGVKEDMLQLRAAAVTDTDEMSRAKRTLIENRLKSLIHFAIREGHGDKVVIMWGRSIRGDYASSLVFDSVDVDPPVPTAVQSHPLSHNVNYLSRGQCSADWFISRRFRITGRSAKALKNADIGDSPISIVEKVLKASFMAPVRPERVKAFELGSAAEPVLRRNLAAFLRAHSNFTTIDVCQDEIGLACRKNFEHCAASIDGLFQGTLTNASGDTIVHGFVEIKTAVDEVTTIGRASEIATTIKSFTCCDYGSTLFNQVVDNDWREQLLQSATTFKSYYGLLVRGSKDGRIIFCVLVFFPDETIKDNLDRLTMLFRVAFDWLYEEKELDDACSGLVVRDQVIWDDIPSPLKIPEHCRDRHTLEFNLSLWIAVQMEIKTQQQPFPRATNFRTLAQFHWNNFKGGVDCRRLQSVDQKCSTTSNRTIGTRCDITTRVLRRDDKFDEGC